MQDRTVFKTVRPSESFAPQIDLLKIHHFDNRAKMTSLKALQVHMRCETVVELNLPFDQSISQLNIEQKAIPYNKHDVKRTKEFALISLPNINFRIGLIDQLGPNCINYNDTKIGTKILEERLGRDLCFELDGWTPRQTFRNRVALDDIIFPYIRFQNSEFARVLSWMKQQTLTGTPVQTKGVFTELTAAVGGLNFDFGTGGIHGSLENLVVVSDNEWSINDIDVASLYPSIAIVNELYPEHLGKRFVFEYAQLPIERKKYKKGTVQNAALKLSANGTYGNFNNIYSPFYDPQCAMTITINGQLMICMLAEWLLTVPSLQLLQANTDGITYRIQRRYLPQAREVQKAWEAYTRLTLEEVEYKRMWLKNVSNYIAEKLDGTLKLKGEAYWYPEKFPDDISNASPSSWHKNLSNLVSTMAAVAHMTNGVPIDQYIRECKDPYLFMICEKVQRGAYFCIGSERTQKVLRYYIANKDGEPLHKIMPPAGPEGEYKRKNGLSDYEYQRIKETVPAGVHDERIHTKNKSRYEIRQSTFHAGFGVIDCCDVARFDFTKVNYEYYEQEARKLVIT